MSIYCIITTLFLTIFISFNVVLLKKTYIDMSAYRYYLKKYKRDYYNIAYRKKKRKTVNMISMLKQSELQGNAISEGGNNSSPEPIHVFEKTSRSERNKNIRKAIIAMCILSIGIIVGTIIANSNHSIEKNSYTHTENSYIEENGTIVYWVDDGTVWHSTPDCPSLARSDDIYSGTITESDKARGCKRCT